MPRERDGLGLARCLGFHVFYMLDHIIFMARSNPEALP